MVNMLSDKESHAGRIDAIVSGAGIACKATQLDGRVLSDEPIDFEASRDGMYDDLLDKFELDSKART